MDQVTYMSVIYQDEAGVKLGLRLKFIMSNDYLLSPGPVIINGTRYDLRLYSEEITGEEGPVENMLHLRTVVRRFTLGNTL